MTHKELMALAGEAGLSAYILAPEALIFRPEVREMCASDKCSSYNRSWSCPPACGTLEELSAKVKNYSSGILVQTVGHMEDDFDYEAMTETGARHNINFRRLTDMLEGRDILALGMGACRLCEKCSYPDAPCRFPEKMYPSMEAAGLLVSDVCAKSGVTYYYGRLTISYTSCILFN